MSAFDPTPGQPYGMCSTCSVALETEDAANEHMRQTMDDAKARGEAPRSHSVSVANPPRERRIRSRVASIVDDAIYQAMSDLDDLLDRGGLTEAEIATALRDWPDFADSREEYAQDGAS